MNKLKKRVKKLEKIVKKLQANQEDEQVKSDVFEFSATGENETPNKKVINPSEEKTLAERLEELDFVSLNTYNEYTYLSTNLTAVQIQLINLLDVEIYMDGKTDDEIVEKVKKIIEILK